MEFSNVIIILLLILLLLLKLYLAYGLWPTCIVQLGGPTWNVQLGRRDSTTANRTNANNDLPKPSMDLPTLIRNFNNQGLDVEDLVALSGAHTIGFAKCSFARQDQPKCPTSGGGRTILGPLDPTPAKFDTIYFSNLVMMKGFLNSDGALCNDNQTYGLVENYSQNGWAFSVAFAKSMIRMGSINPLTGNKGQIRVNCRKVN
ncbi:peroxidase [Sarracenia purpurea var. burkii]